MKSLVRRLHAEQARREDRAASDVPGKIEFRAIFTLDGDLLCIYMLNAVEWVMPHF